MSQHDPNLPQNEKGSSMVKSAIKSILITALVLLSLVAAFFVVGKIITMTQREPIEPGLFERDANNGDVEVSVEYPNLLTAEIIIVAKQILNIYSWKYLSKTTMGRIFVKFTKLSVIWIWAKDM